MFGKLKNKLKEWTKGLTKKADKNEEIIEETKTKEVKKEPEKKQKKKDKKEEIKEVKIPEKFNVGTQKFEPDLEKIKDLEKEIEKEENLKTETKKKLIKDLEDEKKDLEKTQKQKEEKKIDSELIDKEKSNQKERIISEKIPTSDSEEQTSAKGRESRDEPQKQQKKSFFNRLTSKITKIKITDKDFDVYADELEILLLENNVALQVTEKIIKKLREEIVGKELLKKEIESEIKDIFKEIINEILIEPFNLIEKIKNREDKTKPFVILFCGINGTGKTTTIAKIGQQIKDNNLKCVLAAADTFRAASIEQIKKHGERLSIPVVAHEYQTDPASVGFDAIKYAEKNKLDAVLIDTAGRMYTEKNLMSQIEKISRVTKPDCKIFVGESTTGNDIVEQVKSFDWAINIDGIILSKADIDEKGGTALSVGYVTKKPILYLGTGQEYEKIEPFNKAKFIEKLGLDDD